MTEKDKQDLANYQTAKARNFRLPERQYWTMLVLAFAFGWINGWLNFVSGIIPVPLNVILFIVMLLAGAWGANEIAGGAWNRSVRRGMNLHYSGSSTSS